MGMRTCSAPAAGGSPLSVRNEASRAGRMEEREAVHETKETSRPTWVRGRRVGSGVVGEGRQGPEPPHPRTPFIDLRLERSRCHVPPPLRYYNRYLFLTGARPSSRTWGEGV